MLSFSLVSSVLLREKSQRGPNPANPGMRHDYDFVFGQKLTHKHQCVSWYVIMVQNPWLVFPQFCAFLTTCFVQSAHSVKVVVLIDHTTLWQKFMMHHTIAIEETNEQNLHIWLNLTCFFRSWLFCTLPLVWLDFGFNDNANYLE